MRIGLEITGALAGGGYRRYNECLLQALAEVGPQHEYVVFGAYWRGFPERGESLRIPKLPNFRTEFRRLPQSLLYPAEEYLGLRWHENFLEKLGVQVVHGLGTRTPPLERIPSTITLHFSGLWDFKGVWNKFYFEKLTERSVRQSAKIISISEHCARECTKAWGTPREKFVVIPYGGPEPHFAPSDRPPKDPPYFLFVGMTRPQKRPRLLVEAFCRMKARRPDLRHRLVFAGAPGEDQAWLEHRLDQAGMRMHVDFLGLVPQDRVHVLFQDAFACVCPSTEEGFALPAAEAMACGTPVIGVNAGALPETIGDAGLVPEPESEALAEAMERVATEPGLRARLAAKGLERVKVFSWQEAARRTLAVYEDLLAGAR